MHSVKSYSYIILIPKPPNQNPRDWGKGFLWQKEISGNFNIFG